MLIEPRIYEASAGELLALLRELDDDVGSAMLIGHNPGLEQLIADLAEPGPELDRLREKFPTAALATLQFEDPGPSSERAVLSWSRS